VGFVGLGNMGGFMASNLIKGGKKLVVFDLSESAVQNLVKQVCAPSSCFLPFVCSFHYPLSLFSGC
jgi:3-hydroxyisobutyrate dehydrogenase